MEHQAVKGSVAELLELGRMGLELGYRDQAEAYYDEALRQAPGHPDALLGKARATRDVRVALQHVDDALRSRPGHAEALGLQIDLRRRLAEEDTPATMLVGPTGTEIVPPGANAASFAPRRRRGWLMALGLVNVVGLIVLAAVLVSRGGLNGGAPESTLLPSPEGSGAAEAPLAAAAAADALADSGASSLGLRRAEFAIALILVPTQNGTRFASGSGSVIAADGLVLTNYHVVANAAMTELANDDGLAFVGLTSDAREKPDAWYIAAVVASDPARDLAVLRVLHTADGQSARARRFEPLSMAESSTLGLGQPIVALGYPTLGGATITLTRGSMAGFVSEEGVRYGKTDSELLPGSSGGAVLDEQGRMVGVITGALTEERTQGRLSYFVLSSEARDVVLEARNALPPRPDVQWMVDGFADLEL